MAYSAKVKKYHEGLQLLPSARFYPIVVDNMGTWAPTTHELFDFLLQHKSADLAFPPQKLGWVKRLSLSVQRGNAFLLAQTLGTHLS